MERFNEFPMDIQSEILINHHSYLRVKKNLNKKLFYDRHCDKPISVNEFLVYINTNPDDFIIFTVSVEHDSPVFRIYQFESGYLNTLKLYIEQQDADEYILITNYNYSDHTIEELFEIIEYDELYFDIQTTYNIISRRNCEEISSGYNKKITKDIFNKHANINIVNNIYSYFDLYKTLLYQAYNYNLLFNKPVQLNDNIETIIFNTEGIVVDGDIEEVIDDMMEEYYFKNDILNIISKF